MRLIDTNALIHAVSPSVQEAEKRRRAQEILMEDDPAVSVQVPQEFCWQVTRASRADAPTHSRAPMFHESIREFLGSERCARGSWSAVSMNPRLSCRTGTARSSLPRATGCDTVYSEHMSDHQDYDGLGVANPFRTKSRP